ncbi:unnamed protein product [Blepharisma stoltei]|uniref:Uncharacterized protein n=1 Tax=Blepharisma stoltei TaxID=1481888 RepID=A0AAU9J269_9CILI|nr:unnamed protein product [Blepharisma stoltei]
MLLLRRSFTTSVKTPWVFKVQDMPELHMSFDEPSREKMLKFTKTQFTKTFQTICEGFANNDKAALKTILEPTLHKTVCQNLDDLEAEGYKFQFLGIENLEINPLSFEMHIGVNIDRSTNFPSEHYVEISTLESLRAGMTAEDLNKEAEKDGVTFTQDVLQTKLDNIWLYISPRAPANLLIGLDVYFKLLNPLTLVKDGEDIIYKSRQEEVHGLKMENIASVVAKDQEQAIFNGSFQHLMLPLLKLEERTLSKPWTVADIDNIMNGNHHVKSAQKKLT